MGYRLKTSILVSKLAAACQLSYQGDDFLIQGVSTLDEQESNYLVFSKESGLGRCGSIVIEPTRNERPNTYTALESDNPRLDFIRALSYLNSNIGFSTYDFASEIHTSVILGPNVVVENGCRIAEGVVIEANVVIHSGTVVGKNSRIRSCSSIGGDGFGFERSEDGTPVRFPHLGGVLIGENVELGALNSVARGTLSDTIIESHVKTDNLVHIAHNCIVKKAAFLTACAELSGGVIVGERAWIGPNVSVMQKANIGNDSLVGLGAVITKDVGEGSIWAGNPAKKLRDIK